MFKGQPRKSKGMYYNWSHPDVLSLSIPTVSSVKTQFMVNYKCGDMFRLKESSWGQLLKRVWGTSSESAHFWYPKNVHFQLMYLKHGSIIVHFHLYLKNGSIIVHFHLKYLKHGSIIVYFHFMYYKHGSIIVHFHLMYFKYGSITVCFHLMYFKHGSIIVYFHLMYLKHG